MKDLMEVLIAVIVTLSVLHFAVAPKMAWSEPEVAMWPCPGSVCAGPYDCTYEPGWKCCIKPDGHDVCFWEQCDMHIVDPCP